MIRIYKYDDMNNLYFVKKNILCGKHSMSETLYVIKQIWHI